MKNLVLITLSLFLTTITFAQKKERIKGSKSVTIEQKTIASFENLEIEDNLEIFLTKGSTQSLEIEADENLHEIIKYEMYGNTLKISTLKNVTSYKKLSVKVIYTDSLKTITVKNEAVINAVTDLNLTGITIKNLDYSKSYLNVKSDNFTLILNDKTKAELNLKSEDATIELSKNAELKALIATSTLKFDMYQKSNAVIEGDAENAKLRTDNNATFTGKKFAVKDLEIIAESYSKSAIFVTDNLILTATGKAEIQLFGNSKVEMKNFADNAILYKKE